MRPVGTVVGGRTEPEDDGWDTETCEIVLDARFGEDALAGLDAFSHAEVVYQFHLVAEDEVVSGARRPRGRSEWPAVGIFAQRGRLRPNRIGVSICRIVKLDGTRLTVQGLDAVAGSPVLDVKPYLTGFAPRGEVREPLWAQEIMAAYW